MEEYLKKINEIKKLYPLWKDFSNDWISSLHKKLEEGLLINEFISHTIYPFKTKEMLSERYKGQYKKCEVGQSWVVVSFYKENTGSFKEINDFMSAYGWFPAMILSSGLKFNKENLKNSIKNSKYVFDIRYEAKFDFDLNNKDNNIFYHLTPDLYYKKIQLFGLTPKNKSKLSNHPERIYLLNSTTDENYENISYELYQSLEGTPQYRMIHDFYLLEIDFNKMDKTPKIYIDPNFHIANGGVWIYENIPPVCINVINKFNVNQESAQLNIEMEGIK